MGARRSAPWLARVNETTTTACPVSTEATAVHPTAYVGSGDVVEQDALAVLAWRVGGEVSADAGTVVDVAGSTNVGDSAGEKLGVGAGVAVDARVGVGLGRPSVTPSEGRALVPATEVAG